MNEKPLVTVYILIYKDMSRICDLLRSVAAQTYEEIELLISDDGSPNITYQDLVNVTEPYKARFKNIIINKNEENKGTVRHVNGIIPKANGVILSGIGGDDIYYNDNVIENVVDFFKQNKNIYIATSKRFDEGEGVEQPHKNVQQVLKNDFSKYKKVMFRATPQISGTGTFFRRDLFEKYGYFPEEFKLVEDASYYTKLVAQGVKFGFIDKITVIHAAGGVSDKNAIPHPWYVQDMDYLYSTWLYGLVDKDDYFSRRCITYHSKRRKAHRLFQIGILYFLYLDVCIWLFLYYSGKKVI